VAPASSPLAYLLACVLCSLDHFVRSSYTCNPQFPSIPWKWSSFVVVESSPASRIFSVLRTLPSESYARPSQGYSCDFYPADPSSISLARSLFSFAIVEALRPFSFWSCARPGAEVRGDVQRLHTYPRDDLLRRPTVCSHRRGHFLRL